jgi:hypothetical protein
MERQSDDAVRINFTTLIKKCNTILIWLKNKKQKKIKKLNNKVGFWYLFLI